MGGGGGAPDRLSKRASRLSRCERAAANEKERTTDNMRFWRCRRNRSLAPFDSRCN